jgi:hypothetical protein
MYHRDDWETPLLIHKLLERNIDQWYKSYLRPRVEEKKSNPETKVQIEASRGYKKLPVLGLVLLSQKRQGI